MFAPLRGELALTWLGEWMVAQMVVPSSTNALTTVMTSFALHTAEDREGACEQKQATEGSAQQCMA